MLRHIYADDAARAAFSPCAAMTPMSAVPADDAAYALII